MGSIKSFYTNGTDSYFYYVIFMMLYLFVIVYNFIKFPRKYYLLKYLVYAMYVIRIIDISWNKFKYSIIGTIICTSLVFMLFVFYISVAIRPWRNMYIRTKTVLTEDVYIMNPICSHTDTEMTTPNVSVTTSSGIGTVVPPKRSSELFGKLGEAYNKRLKRYIVWQYTEFSIWGTGVMIFSGFLMGTEGELNEAIFYAYGGLVSLAFVIISFRVMYFYGTLLGSLSKDMKTPLRRIGFLMLLQAILLIIPMFNAYFYELTSTILMAGYYFTEVMTVFVISSAFVKGMEFHNKLFNQERNNPPPIILEYNHFVLL